MSRVKERVCEVMQQHNDFDRIAEQQFTAGDTLALVERVWYA